MNGQSTCAPTDEAKPWHQIDWGKANAYVRRMQARIVKATKEGRWNRVKSLQRLLTHSFYGKAVAVKRVNENRGKRTPGVDEETWSTPEAKWSAIENLKRHGYQPKPLKRIYIPKSNGKMRPLSIPTMHDRAMQALYLLALDPVSETISDGNSYGFRKGRSTADAIEACFKNARFWGNPKDASGFQPKVGTRTPRKSAEWILEADIAGCFDNISHDWLLTHVPMDKEVLRKWLKAGYMEGSALSKTESGTPQGGIISPVLANLTLNGLEDLLRKQFTSTEFERVKIHLVRYADDFVITGISKELLEKKIRPAVELFLAERGLTLSPEKTKITHISDGYDFLGQNVRRYGRKLLIKPSAKSVKTFLTKVREIIRQHRSATQEALIGQLNPVIRGWANYHRHAVAKAIFIKIDHLIWRTLWRWAVRRHPNKGKRWIHSRYFHTVNGRRHVFGVNVENPEKKKNYFFDLFRAATVPIKRHVKVQSSANPYDPDCAQYFSKRQYMRMMDSVEGRKQVARLWHDQGGICPHCKELMDTIDDSLSVHHPHERAKGGRDIQANRVLMHEICHVQVHRRGIRIAKPASVR
jgi:RNA-directed DNA polymerase